MRGKHFFHSYAKWFIPGLFIGMLAMVLGTHLWAAFIESQIQNSPTVQALEARIQKLETGS